MEPKVVITMSKPRAALRFKRGQVWWIYSEGEEFDDAKQKKPRPWLIVSNDENNLFAPIITCVPITTRSEARLPVHVFFRNGDRNQVALCEQITTKDIKEFNHPRSYYMYTLSDPLITDINKALSIQLGIYDPLEVEIQEPIVTTEDRLREINSEINLHKNSINALEGLQRHLEIDVKPIEEPKPLLPLPNNNPPGTKVYTQHWSLEKKQQFLKDYGTMTHEAIAAKYNLPSVRSIHNCKYKFKKEGVEVTK